MPESTYEIVTPEGRMETFAAWPEAGPAATTAPTPAVVPAVILYMDAPGIRDELREFCRRIARQGYYTILPDMYYRLGKVRFDLRSFDAEARREMFACMNTLSNELVMSDTRAMLDHLRTVDVVADGPKGCIGYCMSGQYVVSAAGTFPRDFAAAASLYGVGIVTDRPDSPHLLAHRIDGELYLGFAETDEYVPDHVVPTLTRALDEHGVSYRLDTWPGTQHGLCFPQRGPMYHETAAEEVWKIVFDLYARRLSPEG